MNGRSRAGRAGGALLAVACALAACDGTNALDPAVPAAFVERVPLGQPTDTALLRRRTSGLPACPAPGPGVAVDSSATVVLEGAPRLVLRLPAGFRAVTATLPTPTMQRIDGPDGERILVERDPTTLVAWGPAYSSVASAVRFPCFIPAPTRLPAQLQSFGRRDEPLGPEGIVAAVANVPTIVLDGVPVSVAIYARTPERRTLLLQRVTRVRVAP